MGIKHIPQKGLIIDSGHIDRLLNGTGSWEMRGSIPFKCEPVALINPGMSQIVGVANLIAANGTVDYASRINDVNQHRISDACLQAGRFDKWDVVWMLDQVQRLHTLIPLQQPTQDEIWINLNRQLQDQLALAMAFLIRGQE